MSGAQEMPRFDAATATASWPEIYAAQRPVVITGLYDDQPITRIRTLRDAVDFLGDVDLSLTVEYTAGKFASQRSDWSMDIPDMTIAEYAAFIESNPRTSLICVEQDLPAQIASLVTMPALCASDEDDDMKSYFFFGNEGNCSNLHFDGDMRSALLYQIAGRKRAVCVPPWQSSRLFPMNNFSGVMLYRFSDSERAEFLSYAHGCETMLEPGDTLFIPTAWWHHLEYVTTGLSFNFRMKRTPLLRLLGDGMVHGNHRTQALAATLMHDGDRAERVRTGILDALERPAGSADAKFRDMDALFERLYEEVCAHYPQGQRFASLYPCDDAELYRRRLAKGTLYPVARAAVEA